MATGAVVARILTQYSDKGSKAAQKDIKKLGANIDKFAKRSARAFGIAAIASAAALAKIGKDSIMAASDLSQQFGALDAVFGKNADQLKSFSKEMVDYGLSTADAARFAALLGTQLKGLGIEEQEAITRTKQLQVLAADLAATYGGTTADAVAALSSTFKGEYNPIERYGVAIRKSDITARIAAKGLGKLTGYTLKAAEAQEAFELIIGRTTAAQGQSRREYNTLAAQLQRVDATFENIKATLGAALLPVMEKFAGLLITRILPQIEAFVNINKDQLAASFAVAAEFALKFLEAAIAFGNWVANNTGTVKTLAAIIAGMFAVNGVLAFLSFLGTISAALVALRALATTTAIALSFATGGSSAIAGAVGAAAITAAIGVSYGLNKYGASLRKAEEKTGTKKGISPRGNANNREFIVTPFSPVTTSLDQFKTGLDKATKSTKAAQILQDKINAAAAKKNLARQAELSGSSTIAIGARGSKAFSNRGANVTVNVAGSVSTENDLITAVQDGLSRIERRSLGLSDGRTFRL